MKLPTGSRCVKYLVFIFNLLFVISGIILISIGTTIYAVFHSHQHFLNDTFLSAPNLLIATGSIIFIIAFFGCCGAVRENYCMILTFTFLMGLVFILELAGGISGYVLRNEANELIESNMLKSMDQYNKSSEVTEFWDKLQKDFDCCGTNAPKDWMNVTNNTDGKFILPISCCNPLKGFVSDTPCTLNTTIIKDKPGCYFTFGKFIKSHAVQLGGAGLGIAFVQAIGIWFAVHLARAIKTSYETV